MIDIGRVLVALSDVLKGAANRKGKLFSLHDRFWVVLLWG